MNIANIKAVNIGFGNMADEYDRLQLTNKPVQIMRQKYYEVVLKTVTPPAEVLELNCGSGIDAKYFAEKGYNILATDVSDKMLENAKSKCLGLNVEFKNIDINDLNILNNKKFDLILSNLGGLNCIKNLNALSLKINSLLNSHGYFIAVVMPSFNLWEFLLIFKNNKQHAFRRMVKEDALANVGGQNIKVNYYSPKTLKETFAKNFSLIELKALRIFAPPPTAGHWYEKHKIITAALDKIDNILENFYFSSFISDYYIAVFKKLY